MLPLTTACLRALPLHVIRQLVASCPRRALTHPNAETGQLPLHAACSTFHQHSLHTVLFLIQAYPEALQVADRHGNLPLHLAVRFASLQVIETVHQAWPAAIETRTAKSRKGGQLKHHNFHNQLNQQRRLPFHLAMQAKRDADVILFLLSKYPQAVRMLDDLPSAVEDDSTTSSTSLGKLPLHRAIEQDASFEIIQCLVEVDRGILELRDHDGNLPLHCAVRQCGKKSSSSSSTNNNQSSSSIDRATLELAADGMGNSNLPPQYSGTTSNTSTNNNTNRLVMYLLHQGPKNATQIPNAAGDFPLHLACSAGPLASIAIISALVRHFSGAIHVHNGREGFLPLHLACATAAPRAVVEYLVRQYKASVAIPDRRNGCLALHFACSSSMTSSSSSSNDIEIKNSCQVMEYLLTIFPAAATMTDHNGDLPLHHLVVAAASTASKSYSYRHRERLLRAISLVIHKNSGALDHRNHLGFCPWLWAAAAAAAAATTATGSSTNTNESDADANSCDIDNADLPSLDLLFHLAQKSPNSIIPLVHDTAIAST